MGKRAGRPGDPLLVSVRSGAKFSMPGMMETVLNIGLNDESVQGLAKQAGNERFAWDSYRRLIQMFGKTVLGVDGDLFEDALDAGQAGQGRHQRPRPRRRRPQAAWSTPSSRSSERTTGRDFPQDPREQMDLAVKAVFDSWNADRAVPLPPPGAHPGRPRAPPSTSCAMVFGNLGMDSGTGVAFTRDPATGDAGRLRRLPAERAGRGRRRRASATRVPLADLEQLDPKSYDELMDIMATLENHYRDLCDIEFTIERGKLWMLQTRVGKRTAGRGVPDRHPAGRRGPHRHGRGAHAGHRRAAGAADVPALRRERPTGQQDREGHERLAGRGRRQGGLRLRTARQVGAPRRARSSWSAGRPTPTTSTA